MQNADILFLSAWHSSKDRLQQHSVAKLLMQVITIRW